MPDIFLYQGEANPNDIKLRDPSATAVQSLVQTGSGGALAGGIATLIAEALITAIAGGLAGGPAVQAAELQYAAQGGAVVGGAAELIRAVEFSSDGGAVVAGEAQVQREFVIPPQVSSGGGAMHYIPRMPLVEEEKEVIIQSLEMVGSGGAAVGGTAAIQVEHVHETRGGAVIAGRSDVKTEIDETENAIILLLAA